MKSKSKTRSPMSNVQCPMSGKCGGNGLKLRGVFFGALGALMFFAGVVRGEDAVRYESKFGSKVKLEGTSTIHDWTMEGQIIKGFMEWPAGVTLDSTQAALAGAPGGKVSAQVDVAIPVRSIRNAHF